MVEWERPKLPSHWGDYRAFAVHCIVHIGRMHLPDPMPDNHIETRFERDGGGTFMTMRMTLPDSTTRAIMLASGMEHGMEANCARLEKMSADANQAA
jgi:hypothetical protein